MKISRIINRIKYHIQRKIIVLVSYVNHRLHMKMFLPLLKANGMKFTGIPRYIGVNVIFDDFDKVTIGDRVVISDHCHFLTHDYSLTTALISINQKPKTDVAFQKPIVVGNNVFIGKKSIIMPNARIGSNVIIGAGAVVRGRIEDNSIAIGNPCQVISKLDDKAKKWFNIIDDKNTKVD